MCQRADGYFLDISKGAYSTSDLVVWLMTWKCFYDFIPSHDIVIVFCDVNSEVAKCLLVMNSGEFTMVSGRTMPLMMILTSHLSIDSI